MIAASSKRQNNKYGIMSEPASRSAGEVFSWFGEEEKLERERASIFEPRAFFGHLITSSSEKKTCASPFSLQVFCSSYYQEPCQAYSACFDNLREKKLV